MDFPNITYLDGKIVKIKSLEVNIGIDYQNEFTSFITFDSEIIYLVINQYPLRDDFSYDKFNKIMNKAILNCKEISRDLRTSYEYWTGWNFEIRSYKKCTKGERAIYIFEQNKRLKVNFMETSNKRSNEYFKILGNSSPVNNLVFMRPKNKNE